MRKEEKARTSFILALHHKKVGGYLTDPYKNVIL
jgi:hypothetical protein